MLKTYEERAIIKKLKAYAKLPVQLDSEQYVLVRELILLRREATFNKCEFAIYFSRMLLLTSALKLPGSAWLSPVFVAICGLFQSGMQVFKSMRGKKHFHKLTIEDVQARSQKKQEEQAKAADKIHTILVPVDKTSANNHEHGISRARGYNAVSSREFNFNASRP